MTPSPRSKVVSVPELKASLSQTECTAVNQPTTSAAVNNRDRHGRHQPVKATNNSHTHNHHAIHAVSKKLSMKARRPLDGKTVVFDLNQTSKATEQKLRSQIEKLGGKVDDSLDPSKQLVLCVVSDHTGLAEWLLAKKRRSGSHTPVPHVASRATSSITCTNPSKPLGNAQNGRRVAPLKADGRFGKTSRMNTPTSGFFGSSVQNGRDSRGYDENKKLSRPSRPSNPATHRAPAAKRGRGRPVMSPKNRYNVTSAYDAPPPPTNSSESSARRRKKPKPDASMSMLPFVVRTALQQDIRVLTSGEFIDKLKNFEAKKIGPRSSAEKKKLKNAPLKKTGLALLPKRVMTKKLVAPYIKLEHSVEERYKPMSLQCKHTELADWLCIVLGPGTSTSRSLFDAPPAPNKKLATALVGAAEPDDNLENSARNDMCDRLRGAGTTVLAGDKDKQRLARTTRKSPRFNTERPFSPDPDRKGYCEICRKDVDSMAKHASSKMHQTNVSERRFWDVVDNECVSYHPLIRTSVKYMEYHKDNDVTRRIRRDLMPEPIARNTRAQVAQETETSQAYFAVPDALNDSAVLDTAYNLTTAYAGGD